MTVGDWINKHPWTLFWLLMVSTVNLILNFLGLS